MKQPPVLKSLLKKLKDSSLEIRKESSTEDKKYLVFTDTVVVVLDGNRLILSFDVDVRPDFSAFLTNELSKIRGVKEILIGELFMQDAKTKSILTGDEAVKEFMKVSKQSAVSEFIKEQMTDFMLRSERKIPSC